MPAKRGIVGDLTDRELKVIELRCSGIRAGEIARLTGVSRQAIYVVIMSVYRKSGTSNTAQLTRWAWENGLDVAAPPDTPETAAVPVVKVRRRLVLGLDRFSRSRHSLGLPLVALSFLWLPWLAPQRRVGLLLVPTRSLIIP